MNWNIVFYEEIDSTNSEVRRMSRQGTDEGLVVTADRQSAGRGRSGRTWESQAVGNLYFSILLRPRLMPEKAPMLTIVMAYSVAKVLETMVCPKGKSVQIKWPNDVILSQKKVCGILTEMNLTGSQIEDVIIGVGVNLNQAVFLEELQEKATSIYLETGNKTEREELLQRILQEFEKQYWEFLKVQDLSFIQEAYNQMLVNRNCEVRVLEPNNEYTAFSLGINEGGELLVRRQDGNMENIFAGEVSVRGIYGYV